MRRSLILTAIICLITFQIFGCAEDTETTLLEPVEETVENTTDIPTPITPETPEALFKRLWREFGGDFLNQDEFIVLRTVTTSQDYLNYLAETFPTETPVETLEEYFQNVAPEPEKYLPFLQQWTDNPTDQDIDVIHKIINTYRETDFLFFKTLDRDQIGGDFQEHFVDHLFLILEKKAELTVDPAVQDFRQRHNINDDKEFNAAFEKIAYETLKADAIWLDKQMKTHGTDKGLIWSAIHNPALIGEILHNFSSTKQFPKWIELIELIELKLGR